MIQIDIDMPKRCEECPLCVDYDCIIHNRITDEYYDGMNEQYAHCPLIVPSAQPKIIRCKECRYRDEFGCCKFWAGLTMGMQTTATDDDDFCSYAERRTDEID